MKKLGALLPAIGATIIALLVTSLLAAAVVFAGVLVVTALLLWFLGYRLAGWPPHIARRME